MPGCVNCGGPLPPEDFEAGQQLCPQCREQILAQPVPRRVSRPATPSFPVTNVLLGLNVIVYGLMTLSGVSPFRPDPEQLLRWGADYGPLTLTTQPWRLLSATFVHGGLLHIATNMWCLWNLGRMAENIFGRFSFLLVYLFTGISASLLSVLLHPDRVSVGASGAIFGVAGALITALYLGKLPIPQYHLKATLNSLVFFAVVNLAIGASLPVIDNTGHIGGLVAGLLVGTLLAPSLTRDGEAKARSRQLIFSALAVLLGAAIWFVRKSF
jgi:rhomboid protease GluP